MMQNHYRTSDSMLYRRRDETKAVYKSQWWISDILQEFGIMNEIVAVTVDNTANMNVVWPVGKITDTHPQTGDFGPPPSKLRTTPMFGAPAEFSDTGQPMSFLSEFKCPQINIWGGCRKALMVMLHTPFLTIALVPHA